MKAVIFVFWLLPGWIAGLSANTAVAAEPTVRLPEIVTIPRLFEITRDISPRFETVRQRLELANAEIVAAKVLPNPRINYGRFDLLTSKNTMFDGNVQQQVTLEVPILVSGQRGASLSSLAGLRSPLEAFILKLSSPSARKNPHSFKWLKREMRGSQPSKYYR